MLLVRARPNALRHGAALVASLGLLMALTAFALSAFMLADSAWRSNVRRARRAGLQAAAREAAALAIQRLADDEDLLCDHPGEAWAQPAEWTTPEPESVQVRLTVEDGSSRFDVNNLALPREEQRAAAFLILRDLMREGGHPHAQTAAGDVRDAIGRDGNGGRPSRGDRPSGPHRALLSPAEFERALGGMPEGGAEAWRWMDTVTLHPSAPEVPEAVNINTASEDTLRGMLGPSGRVLAARLVRDRTSMPYRSVRRLGAAVEPPRLTFLDVRSRWFIIRVFARDTEGGVGLQVTAVRGPEGTVRVIRWEWMASAEGAEPDGLIGGEPDIAAPVLRAGDQVLMRARGGSVGDANRLGGNVVQGAHTDRAVGGTAIQPEDRRAGCEHLLPSVRMEGLAGGPGADPPA